MMDKNIIKLNKYGLNTRYQYDRYEDGYIVTTCYLEKGRDNILAKGYSICSPLDQFRKSTARNKSCGRALGALENKAAMYEVSNENVLEKGIMYLGEFK